MDITLSVFVVAMLPVIFFGLIVPFLKFFLWISVDLAKGRWYGFMIYMIGAAWSLGISIAACYFWIGYWLT